MRLTGPGHLGPDPPTRARRSAVLRRAVELGVNLIDTADSYGPDVSEELIAEALHPYPDELVIATKGGLVGPARAVARRRPARAPARGVRGQPAAAALERIDLYQLHRIDPQVPDEESFGALKELPGRGQDPAHRRLERVASTQLERARGIVDVVSVQNRYNLARPRRRRTCSRRARARASASSRGSRSRSGKLAAAGRPARASRGSTRHAGAVALAWLLRRSPVMLPIPGTSTVAHLEENVAAAGVALSTAIAELEALVAQDG